ncbi:MAG: L-seryl-tRNA(Ser) seleniumtransferase [Actinomycetota bacterium]|jgi:L-seryl-tRNA(Ser) seleniumtransferase|nr:L-seryl-tRNA(Ser) seleniumtransferase [Actinomycetota bacterium]
MASPSRGHEPDLSLLPSVDRVLDALGIEHSHKVSVAAVRHAIDKARAAVRAGGSVPSLDAVVADTRLALEDHARSLLVPVINATGVVLHTNLGRAPLGERQLDAVARAARGYSNLEYDLTAGARGSRHDHARGLLAALTGAEAALVVNNNAAAVLVTLATLCGGREVIISRGELVEIGGEFRIPDIMATSGARLVEVGTTNRTHLADYEKAITPDTAAILKVHPSNYTISGFTASVAARDIARLARGRKICFIHDIGSGLVSTDRSETTEPGVREALEDGADVVTFSGDKLLGGPQAGVIVGRAELIERISHHPLLRALRVDKMTLAALEETLRIYLDNDLEQIPTWRMSNLSSAELEARAGTLRAAIAARVDDSAKIEVLSHPGLTGGGAMPGTELASWAVSVGHATKSAAEIERSLRSGTPAVVARIEDDRVLLDVRTVQERELDVLTERVVAALT